MLCFLGAEIAEAFGISVKALVPSLVYHVIQGLVEKAAFNIDLLMSQNGVTRRPCGCVRPDFKGIPIFPIAANEIQSFLLDMNFPLHVLQTRGPVTMLRSFQEECASVYSLKYAICFPLFFLLVYFFGFLFV